MPCSCSNIGSTGLQLENYLVHDELRPTALKLAGRSSRLQDWPLVGFKVGQGEHSVSNQASLF